jgi:uncharacterized protein (TIGR02145 family)
MKIENISLKLLFKANLLVLFLISSFLIFGFEKPKVSAEPAEADAIAVRIIPNPNHFSAQRWYQAQGFTGSPQSLVVDGYKAVRDGRTVYVSATNIVFSDSPDEEDKLYTNIYLISHDQGADAQTVDIFGQILENWKFNTNLNDEIGACFFSSRTCHEDADCPGGYVCGNDDFFLQPFQKNKCVLPEEGNILSGINHLWSPPSNTLKNTPYCLLDSDCPGSLFCSSLKSRIIRDVDRLEKIMIIKDGITSYYNNNGKYPALSSGTYLPHVVVSTWPSWQNVFLNEIGLGGIEDPINVLGSCYEEDENFNLNTCWDATTSSFYGTTTNYTNFELPVASLVIAYISNENGSDYDLCAVMETAYLNEYEITDGALSDHSCGLGLFVGDGIGLVGVSENTAPYVLEYSLEGQSGQEFAGFIKAKDDEGHPIYWEVNTDNEFFPQLLNTGNPNQKMLWAEQAGNPGNYPITVTLTDSLGSSSTEVLTISITSPQPQIIGGNVSHNLSYGEPFSAEYIINVVDSANTGIEVCSSYNPPVCSESWVFNLGNPSLENINNGFNAELEELSSGVYSLKITGDDLSTGTYYYKIKIIAQSYDISTEKTVEINITANSPTISLTNCAIVAELGDYYSCEIKAMSPLDEITVTNVEQITESLPDGLSFDAGNNKISGIAQKIGSYEIEIEVENQFGKTDSKKFNLNVVSNCGNYLVKFPGGPWNSSGTMRTHGGYYKTVLIGNQCWFADNLNFGEMVDAGEDQDTDEKYCYNNGSINCDVFGGLYQWNEDQDWLDGTDDHEGVCPEGWRMPNEADWDTLSSVGVNKLKTSSYWEPSGGNNESGFSALPGGQWNNSFNHKLERAYWWTSTKYSNDMYGRVLISGNSFSVGSENKSKGFSLRCILDISAQEDLVSEEEEIEEEEDIFFPCGESVEYEGYSYSTVEIGDQCWFRENLKYLPEVHSNSEYATQNDNQQPAFGVYGYDGSDIDEAKEQSITVTIMGGYSITLSTYGFGVLYNGHAIRDLDLCPEGWSVPSDNDWKTLEGTVDSEYGLGNEIWDEEGNRGYDAGERLKADFWDEGLDSFDFSALPSGMRLPSGEFNYFGSDARFWSATPYGTFYRWRGLVSGSNQINRSNSPLGWGFSVRCFRDN